MARIPSRFQRQPGTTRKYLDTETGRVINRRERDAIAREIGEHKPMPLARATVQRVKHRRYTDLVNSYAKETGMTARAVRENAQFKQAVRDLQSKSNETRVKALKSLGRRKGIPAFIKQGESGEFYKSGVYKENGYKAQLKAWRAYKREAREE